MTSRLAAFALAALWLSPALAQTSMGVSGQGSDQGSLPPGWHGALADAFFEDPGAGTLRTQRDVEASWPKLSPEQQAEVRSYCASLDAPAPQQPASDAPTQDNTPNLGAMTRLCEWIGQL